MNQEIKEDVENERILREMITLKIRNELKEKYPTGEDILRELRK